MKAGLGGGVAVPPAPICIIGLFWPNQYSPNLEKKNGVFGHNRQRANLTGKLLGVGRTFTRMRTTAPRRNQPLSFSSRLVRALSFHRLRSSSSGGSDVSRETSEQRSLSRSSNFTRKLHGRWPYFHENAEGCPKTNSAIVVQSQLGKGLVVPPAPIIIVGWL